MVIIHKMFIIKKFDRSPDILVTWIAVMCYYISLTVYSIKYVI